MVTASIDSTELWVGDQAQMHLQVQQKTEEVVDFPVYGEEVIAGIEIVSRADKDTVTQADGSIIVSQDYTITSFKDSLFLIPAIPFVHNGDTLLSNPLTLNVIQPFEVDTASNAITDIKPIYAAPIWWWGIIRWILLGLGIIGLGVGIYYLVRYIRAHKKDGTLFHAEPEIIRPAEEIALEKLDKIKEEKIWQSGRVKEYFTDITDVLREYMDNRYHIDAQEMTSNEILTALKPLLAEQKDLLARVKEMLRVADLVKFAKWTTQPDENELALRTAYTFVNETTPQELADSEEETESINSTL